MSCGLPFGVVLSAEAVAAGMLYAHASSVTISPGIIAMHVQLGGSEKMLAPVEYSGTLNAEPFWDWPARWVLFSGWWMTRDGGERDMKLLLIGRYGGWRNPAIPKHELYASKDFDKLFPKDIKILLNHPY